MNAYIVELADTDPLKAFAALSRLPYSLLLDSADLKHSGGRYSFIASHPAETLEADSNRITITNGKGQLIIDGDPFVVLKDRLSHYRSAEPARGLPPFQGGAAGFFGYDMARTVEKLPVHAKKIPDMPDMAIGIYDQVMAYDHLLQKAWVITNAPSEAEARIKQKILFRALEVPFQNTFTPVHLEWHPNFDPFEYTSRVKKIIDYIRAGDIFQANFAQRFDAELPAGFCPFSHYLRLRTVNPAPFAGFMNLGAIKISSASPERFLTVKEQQVETRPIKGTRPRGGDPVSDALYRAQLENSEKDRAENIMIVDLLRNDLSKVCEAHSIEVPALCRLESFASVHHLVSTIRGKLKNDAGALDLLRACFPGGSISGAPKIRAMEIIDELEPTRRGPYCGAMGYIGYDGTMDTNLLIRTLVYNGNAVSFQAGGGITADSDPDAEYQESFDKADALFHSFEDMGYEVDEEFMAMAGLV